MAKRKHYTIGDVMHDFLDVFLTYGVRWGKQLAFFAGLGLGAAVLLVWGIQPWGCR